MNTELNAMDHARALNVAENLRHQLEERLNGKIAEGWGCSCGEGLHGLSKAVAISMPKLYPYQIAMFTLWSCEMKDKTGGGWGLAICNFIPWAELYPMFRNAFAGIDIQIDHPHAHVYNDQPDRIFGDRAAREGRTFTASGRFVDVDNETPAYVRPIGDLTRSAWVNAELRVDHHLERHATKKPLIACNVDPLEFGQRSGRGGQYFDATDPDKLPTTYVRIPAGGDGRIRYSPIARLVAIDKTTGKAMFELDRSVEVFKPAVKVG